MEYVFWHVIEYGCFCNAVAQDAADQIKERMQKGSVHWQMYAICAETYKTVVIENGFDCNNKISLKYVSIIFFFIYYCQVFPGILWNVLILV